MKAAHRLLLACAGSAFVCAAPVAAQTADPGSPPADSPVPSLFAQPVDSETLSGFRGGAQVRNSMTLDGVTADNSAYEVYTGSNTISEGSFSNMSGLPIVVQNSGANVLIQNAVILNVTMD